MINPNNYRELALSLTEALGYIISEKQLESLSEQQRKLLTTLLWLNKSFQVTKEGKHPLAVVSDILKKREGITKTEFYLQTKKNI
jgi:hypothetical protein